MPVLAHGCVGARHPIVDPARTLVVEAARAARVTIHRYLAIVVLPRVMDQAAFRRALERVAHEALEIGVRPEETWYSLDAGQAFTLFDSDSEDRIRDLHERVGLHHPRIMRVERVYTELLEPPYRTR